MRLLRRTTLTLGAVWGACVVFLVARYPRSYPWVAWLSLAYPAYHAALAVRLTGGRVRPDAQKTKLR